MSSSHKRNPLAPLRCARHDALRTRGPCPRRQPATRACRGSTNEDRFRHRLPSPCVSPPSADHSSSSRSSYPTAPRLLPPTPTPSSTNRSGCSSAVRFRKGDTEHEPEPGDCLQLDAPAPYCSSSQPARLPDTPSRSPTPHPAADGSPYGTLAKTSRRWAQSWTLELNCDKYHTFVVTTNSLTGSIARSTDPELDRRRAHELLRSTKDRREHAAIVDAVRDVLVSYCRKLLVPTRPSVIGTGRLWHLSSWLKGRLADPAIDAITLTAALHPTPAVCGTPTTAASAHWTRWSVSTAGSMRE
jgi:chorismate binding enzyme